MVRWRTGDEPSPPFLFCASVLQFVVLFVPVLSRVIPFIVHGVGDLSHTPSISAQLCAAHPTLLTLLRGLAGFLALSAVWLAATIVFA